MADIQKLCTVCGEDVATKKRTKDEIGQYYCEKCFIKKAKSTRANVKPPYVAAAGKPGGAAAVNKAPPDDGMLDLLPVREEAPKDTPKAACSSCKKLLPEKQVRNINGEFICNACFAKRNQKTAPAKAKTKSPSAQDAEEEQEDSDRFSDSATGGLLISGGILLATFGMFVGLQMMWPADSKSTLFVNIFTSLLETVFVAFRAAGLLISMLVAARMLGGISFGYIGAAFYKAVGFFAGMAAFDFFMDRFESLAMLGFGFRFVLIAVAFILIFKIDMFEAFLLAVVNSAISFGLSMALTIVLIAFALRGGGSDDTSFSEQPERVPAVIAPKGDKANPPNAQDPAEVPAAPAESQPQPQ